MLFTKRCIVCGKLYKTENTRTRYCSLECKDAGTKQLRKAWLEAHPGYNAQKVREHREREKAQQPPRQPRVMSDRFNNFLQSERGGSHGSEI